MLETSVKDKRFFEVKKKIKKDSKQSLTELAPFKKALNFNNIEIEPKYRYFPVSSSSMIKVSDKNHNQDTISSIKMR